MILRGRFSTRRKILLAVVLLALAWLVYGWFTGIAITRGVEKQDMDWNGDGQVSNSELLQAFYAVIVKDSEDGNRHCRSYRWRSTGQEFRVDCRTVFKKDGD